MLFKPQPCEVCGTSENINRHHRDRNPRNNDPANIAFLCRTHHLLEHGYLRYFLPDAIEIPDDDSSF